MGYSIISRYFTASRGIVWLVKTYFGSGRDSPEIIGASMF